MMHPRRPFVFGGSALPGRDAGLQGLKNPERRRRKIIAIHRFAVVNDKMRAISAAFGAGLSQEALWKEIAIEIWKIMDKNYRCLPSEEKQR